MKIFSIACAIALSAISAFGAVPDYKAFRGIGGITVTTNPPTGTVVIDGSGISAGALPSYALTNNQSSDVNLVEDLRVGGVFSNVTSAIFLGNVTNNGTLHNVGDVIVGGGGPGTTLYVLRHLHANFVVITNSANILGSLNVVGWVNIVADATNQGSTYLYGSVFYPSLTPSVALVLDANGLATTPSGTPSSSTFLNGANAYSTISSNSLVASAVNSSIILDGTIATVDVADNSITGAKIAMGSDAQGDILYYNGTDWVRLAAGTSGHFLKTLGAGANPEWAEATGGSGTPGGVSGDIQFVQGSSFAGTNDLIFDRTNRFLGVGLISGGVRRPEYSLHISNSTLLSASIALDSISSANPIRMRINPEKIGTEATVGGPVGWRLTAGAVITMEQTPTQVIMGTNVLFSAGNIVSTSRVVAPIFMGNMNSNHVADAILNGGSGEYECYLNTNQNWNIPVSSSRTVTLLNFQPGVEYSFTITNGASTITWSQPELQWNRSFDSTTYPTLQNGIYKVKMQRLNGVTNAWEVGPEPTLSARNLNRMATNGNVIYTESTTQLTNYSDGNITIDCSSMVSANVTNAIGGNRSITLASLVPGMNGSLSFTSDSTPRTMPVLCAEGSITWMSTNDTASATNILTTASKDSIFAYKVRLKHLSGSAPITNVQCWVKNQTP